MIYIYGDVLKLRLTYKANNITYKQQIERRNFITSTALQVINFDFYGDELIALKDNATGEVYASITHILRGIGFTEKQIEYQKKKMMNDVLLRNSIRKFSGGGFKYAKCKRNNMYIKS